PIEVWKVDRDWVEHSVTYANKPLRTELFTKDIVINKEQRYIEFDVLEYAQSVVMGDEFNFGFELKATTFGAESSNFFTKESSKPPQLIVTYYDPRIWNTGESVLESTLFAYGVGNSDLEG